MLAAAMTEPVKKTEKGTESGPPRLTKAQRTTLGIFAGIFVLSIVARAALSDDPTPSTPQGALTMITPGAEVATPAGEEPGAVESLLPYFSEASFFGLIGFAVGYGARKVVKLALLVIAGFFLFLQVLVFADVATIDWGRAVDLVNSLILNLKENRTITEVLVDRVPSTGAFLSGWFLGFRKG